MGEGGQVKDLEDITVELNFSQKKPGTQTGNLYVQGPRKSNTYLGTSQGKPVHKEMWEAQVSLQWGVIH